MRKNIFLAIATTALALSACSGDAALQEVSKQGTEANTAGAIDFNVLVNKSTRGLQVNSVTDMQASSIQVFGFYSTGAAFGEIQDNAGTDKGTELSYTNSRWNYTNKAYWPTDGSKLDFYGVWPNTVQTLSITATNKQINNFTVDNDVAKQVDLLYALTKDKDANPVVLHFKHALTSIKFKAVALHDGSYPDNPSVRINSMTLHNVNNSGDFTFPVGTTTNDATNVGTWSNVTGSASYTFSTPAGEVSDGTDASDLMSVTGPLFVIPQTVSPWTTSATTAVPTTTANTSGDKYLEIECYIKDTAGDEEELVGSESGGTYTYGKVYVPLSAPDGAWKEGKQYTYTLKFGYGYNADGTPVKRSPIIFEVEVDEWDDTPSDVTLP